MIEESGTPLTLCPGVLKAMSTSLAIFAWHKIGPPSAQAWETWYYVPSATFRKQLRQLLDGGWTIIDDATLLRALQSPDTLPDRAAMITFDDGYRSILEHAAPILSQMKLPAVAFVPTALIGKGNDWDANTREPVEPICTLAELRELESAGISVQSHAATHRTFSDLSADEIDREVRESKALLEAGLAKRVELLAYPFDDAGKDPSATDASLRRHGYRAAFHFVGGAVKWPVGNVFHLTRVPVWPDSELTGEGLSARSKG